MAGANCTHLIGNGGGKGAVRRVWRQLKRHRFVIRTDVKSYYASIDHQHLLERLSLVIQDRRVLNLIGQYLRRTAERVCVFWESERGIPVGPPLSPILGAFFLAEQHLGNRTRTNYKPRSGEFQTQDVASCPIMSLKSSSPSASEWSRKVSGRTR